MHHRILPLALPLSLMAACGLTSLASADIDPNAGMLRSPDISADSIVFVYANDLWTADRDGGMATPLASPQGVESHPRFSPNGDRILFSGNYDGGRDLYVVSSEGGNPERITHHPTGEGDCDWADDDTVIFTAAGMAGLHRMPKIFTMDADGGLPEQLPVPYGAAGALDEDGTWLAYTPNNRDSRTWKRYRGGMASDIWLLNLKTKKSRRVTDWEGTDTRPMWHDGDLYYLSDRGKAHRMNLWKYDVKSKKHSQITKFKDLDVKWPSMGPGPDGDGEIIFQLGPDLKVVDLDTKKSRTVEITIPGDRPTLRTKRVNAAQFAESFDISPSGKRIVGSARGELWTAPAEHGVVRNLSHTDGAAERTPAWSPDGRWIAYFSDETGEYELYVTQSDGKGETTQLTEGSKTFYYNPVWSPDSKKIAYHDKAAKLFIYDFETEEANEIDQDPFGNMPSVSWSQDSNWITYARSGDNHPMTSVVIYDIANSESHTVTHGMFSDTNPVFDRKGEWLYFASARIFSPTYSGIDTTFVYENPMVLMAVPLRTDIDAPWLIEPDEVTWKEEEEEEEDADEESDDEESDDDESDDEASDDDESDDEDSDDDGASEGHPLEGDWAGSLSGLSAMGAPPEMDSIDFTLSFQVDEDGTITGSSVAMGESSDFDSITFDMESGKFEGKAEEEGMTSIMRGTLDGDSMEGEWELVEAGASGTWSATKLSGSDDKDDDDADSDEEVEALEIEFDGFEARAMMLPVSPGMYGNLAVNDKNQLLYVSAGGGVPSIKLFDLKDDSKSEKTVQGGVGGFGISADGKKLIYAQGNTAFIRSASAGGSGKAVQARELIMHIDPRAEWKQLVRDAWRIQRDFFYVENMHGVDWEGVYDGYSAMLDDAVTREDVSFIIREMISELNVGHAYYWGGDGETSSSRNVGMLGVDWEINDGAYRIKDIIHGGPWDVDARNPLMRQGIDIKEGHYILAVNGIPMDTDSDPWSAFLETAGKDTMLTVSESPEMNDEAREVLVRPMGNDGQLRYRGWIEHNRAYVDEQSDGKIGYIYVPNTGVNGQNDLFRQFFGQMSKDALIIDERWNGGGQIPTRFIELLNRPVTNYWATRDSTDWTWPPDAHQGPKCMLINGLAGSGGDMFPWLFRENDLGPLIGTRTWGGLVGISGNPTLIDGGYTAVPTFGFYERDGSWGIEGHGVDPDIEVIDDPAKMVDGGDPQLDMAIKTMKDAIKKFPYKRPKAPKAPDRSGMGIEEKDK